MSKRALAYVVMTLGILMILAGMLSLLYHPAPEIATAGVTLLLASGLIGSTKNGNGKGR